MVGLNEKTYHQHPDDIMWLGIKKDLHPNSRMMYDVLMYFIQKKSRVTLKVSHDEFERYGKLNERNQRAARLELQTKRRITVERKNDGFVYTLLSPSTGKPWEGVSRTKDGGVDFTTLTAEQTEKYFRHRLGNRLEPTSNGYKSRCPFHNGDGETLDITLKKGGAWKCWSCDAKGRLIDFELAWGYKHGNDDMSRTEAQKAVVDVLRHTGAIEAAVEAPEAIYRYYDADGKFLFEKVRYPGKDFMFRRPDPNNPTANDMWVWNINGVRRVLYNLPSVVDADVVLVVEGEKDCDRLTRLNLTSDWAGSPVAVTTPPFGASQWEKVYSLSLETKRVIVIPDNDGPGEEHARTVCKALDGIAREVIVRQLPVGIKDSSEFLNLYPAASDFINWLDTSWIPLPADI